MHDIDNHKPANIEITATFPELGCHFHSVLRREELRITVILETVIQNKLNSVKMETELQKNFL